MKQNTKRLLNTILVTVAIAACSKKQAEAEVAHYTGSGASSGDSKGSSCSGGGDEFEGRGDSRDEFDSGSNDRDDDDSVADNFGDRDERSQDEGSGGHGSQAGNENDSDDSYDRYDYQDQHVGFALKSGSKCGSEQKKTVWYCEGRGGIFNPSSGPYSSKAACESKCGYAMKCYSRSSN